VNSGPLDDRSTVIAVKEAGAAAVVAEWLADGGPRQVRAILAHEGARRVLAERAPLAPVIRAESMSDAALGEALTAWQPSTLLVGASVGPSIEKDLTRYGRAHGLEVQAFVDAFVNPWQRFANPDSGDGWYFAPTVIHVPHPFVKQRLVDCGAQDQTVRVYAHPALSRPPLTVEEQTELVASFRHDYSLDSGTRLSTVICEQGMPKSDTWRWDNEDERVGPVLERVVEIVLEQVGQSRAAGESAMVLLKLHPTDRDPRLERALLRHAPDHYRLIYSAPSAGLCAASDTIIGIGSMLLHEAAVLTGRAYCVKESRHERYPFPFLTPALRVWNAVADVQAFPCRTN
jgi:hypothetical protein